MCGRQIRKLRYARSWSQSHLALKCQLSGWDISRDIIANYEGGRKVLSDCDIVRLAQIFGVRVADVFPIEIRNEKEQHFSRDTPSQ